MLAPITSSVRYGNDSLLSVIATNDGTSRSCSASRWDYEVFVLARIREEYDRTGDTGQAVVSALARTGRLVTCAALILAICFVSLSIQLDIIVRLISTALAFGIILDAVVVRTLLVPALVALLGRWNCWMPDPLARLLRISSGPRPQTMAET